MTYAPILANISKHIHLSPEESDHFHSLLKEKKFAKKEFILKEGQICRSINYVQSGSLRAYYTDKTGKESTIMFAVADWWVTDMFCFINTAKSMLTIESLEESIVLQLQKKDLDQLYISIPKFERYFRILMQNAYIREQLRVIQNLSQPAETRYQGFLDRYPRIAAQVTQKQIASYIGISPEFLSKIRKRKK